MKLTEGMAELVGALIGDGYIYRKNGKYQIGFVGNPKTDVEYYTKLQKLILSEWNKKANIKFRERGIRMVIDSKETSDFLVNNLRICYGEGKCEKVKIPHEMTKDWKLARNVLRGIVDTDGSVFIAQKQGAKNYPSIEITTSSIKLANQIRNILIKRNFRVANIWSYKSKMSKRITYKVPLNGKENLRKWIDKIGFSNTYKLERAINYLKN
jgi:DNA-binding transcriptional regulator WhiA